MPAAAGDNALDDGGGRRSRVFRTVRKRKFRNKRAHDGPCHSEERGRTLSGTSTTMAARTARTMEEGQN